MAMSQLSRNLMSASRCMTRSFSTSTKLSSKKSLNLNQALVSKPLTHSRRQFSEKVDKAKEKLSEVTQEIKDLTSENYRNVIGNAHKWTTQNLEAYLREFASKNKVKQEDLDYLMKTFITGPDSVKNFFSLGRDALKDKVGNADPERVRIGRLLVADVNRQLIATRSQFEKIGAVLIVAAALLGAYTIYRYMFGGKKEENQDDDAQDTKQSVKKAASDAKDSAKETASDMKDKAKSAASDAKESAKSAKNEVKGAAKDVHETSKSDMEEAKKKTAQAFKDDGAIGKQFTEKGAIGGAAQKVGGPFDKEGAIGKQFTKDGAIGGKVQEKAEEEERKRK